MDGLISATATATVSATDTATATVSATATATAAHSSMKESTQGGGAKLRALPTCVEAARCAASFMDGCVAVAVAVAVAEINPSTINPSTIDSYLYIAKQTVNSGKLAKLRRVRPPWFNM